MGKNRTHISYRCSNCGFESVKWSGQCSECRSWNCLDEIIKTESNASTYQSRDAILLSDIDIEQNQCRSTNISELDRVLGGGIVAGSVTLLGGEPGIGKSTLALQAAANLSKYESTLYVSGEESLSQVALRAERIGVSKLGVHIFSVNDVEIILEMASKKNINTIIIDSIQTISHKGRESTAGSLTQIRECSEMIIQFAKNKEVSVILIGHVTKEGNLAGPKTLEHLVDTVLYFEGDATSRFRLIRSYKNRFGAINEVGIFAMTEQGLKGVNNPSAMFLSGGNKESAGTSILVTQEASRPMLLEVQALVAKSGLVNPRRLSMGYDGNRLGMLLAILQRHAGLVLTDHDVFVNIVGGVKVTETAADLAVCASLISSAANQPLGQKIAFFGEIGLSGEARPVPRGEERIKEAMGFGCDKVYFPESNRIRHIENKEMLYPIKNAADLKIKLLPN